MHWLALASLLANTCTCLAPSLNHLCLIWKNLAFFHVYSDVNFKFASITKTEKVVFIVQLRVSSEISNAPFILNLDCDMYANNADSILEALCFFLDEKNGHKTAFVQHPQNYDNLTKNDIYGNASFVTNAVSYVM